MGGFFRGEFASHPIMLMQEVVPRVVAIAVRMVILQRHEHGEYVGFVHGTGRLDAFAHFTEVDVARSLHVSLEFRSSFLVARVDTRRYGVSYVSCHSFS